MSGQTLGMVVLVSGVVAVGAWAQAPAQEQAVTRSAQDAQCFKEAFRQSLDSSQSESLLPAIHEPDESSILPCYPLAHIQAPIGRMEFRYLPF